MAHELDAAPIFIDADKRKLQLISFLQGQNGFSVMLHTMWLQLRF